MPCILYTQRLQLSTAWIVAIHPYCKINALTLATSRKRLRCHWRLQQRDCRALNVTQVWHSWFWSRLFLLSFVACLLASVERALRKLQAQVVDVPCKLSDPRYLDIQAQHTSGSKRVMSKHLYATGHKFCSWLNARTHKECSSLRH